ncbi:TlpA family protein disulfide reductase [Brachybacterium phenoliresistens]|uniref:Alkyl hydroperoxide reductase n=1 Tax=Brachybacterium phenoliresistens TaxID=396014 RepID=Z9JVC8_9MICO|nr:TlpA disulfide reductase family protein [Brachybacterium phenoliresistens]EWS81958.1 alkyl hydroperoxide reductase [Brachybacterium phenoliresistens]
MSARPSRSLRLARSGSPAITRRTALSAAGAAGGALLLAACGTDTSGRYDSGYVAGDGVTAEIPADERGEPLEFSGTTYDGEAFSSVDARGEVLVLNVWYASCPPCRAEAPDLKAIAEEYADQGVRFLGVNVRDEAGPAQAFEEKYQIPYPSLPDLDATILYALRGSVAPNAVPSTLVIDVEGRVAARISGAADPSVLRTMIDTVLAE